MLKILTVLFTLQLLMGIVKGFPAAGSSDNVEVPPPEMLNFMKNYGYLDEKPNGPNSMYHKSTLVNAIKNLQKYGGLNETGTVNAKTMELLTKPRCGVRDIETKSSNGIRSKRYAFTQGTWRKRNLKYSIMNLSTKIPRNKIERGIVRAFNEWSQHSNLKFQQVGTGTTSDIRLGFGVREHGDGNPFDGPGNNLAHAFHPYHPTWSGDVHFDDDENWRANTVGATDFYSVAIHEIGHALGLDHSPDQGSVMFAYNLGTVTLNDDDKNAMFTAYKNAKLDDDIDDNVNTNYPLFTPPVVSLGTSTTSKESRADSSCYLNNFLYMFRGEYVWKYTAYNVIDPDYPQRIHTVFSGIPQRIKHINSCYKRSDNVIIFTSDNEVLMHPMNLPAQNFNQEYAPIESRFDAECYLNDLKHLFKGEYVWKLSSTNTPFPGYPKKIHEAFNMIPQFVKHIDACYQRSDKNIIFSSGFQIYILNMA